MATVLAQQLSKIAANSTNSLNLKAQKASHSQSLIFEPRVAASQSFDTIYTLCHEGFQELCHLDGRFVEFQRDLFSEQSQRQERTQMTAADNADLDKRLELLLGLIGARIRLSPAIKCVEWLVRRFRVHEYNTSFLLTTFLPYYTLPVFTTLLSILPKAVPREYQFLQPYIRSLQNPPRHAIVYAAIKNPTFLTTFNSYVLHVSDARQHYSVLLAFWAGVMTEALAGTLDKKKSGRKAVDYQNEQDVVLQWLPVLNEGLSMKKVPELRIGCYMLLATMASKSRLEDKVLTAMMEAIVLGWTADTVSPGLVCIAILSQQRGAKQLTRRVTRELWKVTGLQELLVELSAQRRVDKLANGLCLAVIERLGKTGDYVHLSFVGHAIQNQLLTDAQATVITKALLLYAHRVDQSVDATGEARAELASCLVKLCSLAGEPGVIVRQAITDSKVDMDELELKLQTSLQPKLLEAKPSDDVIMEDTDSAKPDRPSFSELFKHLPSRTVDETTFLSHKKSHIYGELCRAFLVSVLNEDDLATFDAAPILRADEATTDSLYFSFFAKTWCGPHPVLARAAALQLTIRRLQKVSVADVDIQALIPYAIVALTDPAVKVRRAAAEMTLALANLYPEVIESKKKTALRQWASGDLYDEQTTEIKWLSTDDAAKLLRNVICPALEECVISNTHITYALASALNSSHAAASPKKHDSGRFSQSFRASILSNLASHIVNTPLFSVKLKLLACLNATEKIGGVPRTRVLLPALQQWSKLTAATVRSICQEEVFDPEEMDQQSVSTVVASDKEGMKLLGTIVRGETEIDRPNVISAVFERLKTLWPELRGDAGIEMAQLLMDVSQGQDDDSPLASSAMDLLRSVRLSTDILLAFLLQLPTVSKMTDSPVPVKRRRTSHGEEARLNPPDSKELAASIRKVTFVLQLIESSNLEDHQQLLPGLFNVLAELQHYKQQISSELGYLQTLVLGSLLTILNFYKADPKIKLDRAAIREDVLVDCIQKSSSPQVQSSALLLIAALAGTVPELILHSVMPIFTFMGNSILRQNDEYSAHVIGQTIREVIPPLIASLRKEKGNPVTGAATLLSSFVAAYEHVPSHRRKTLFVSLVQTLRAEDFLFALLAMLSDKYGGSEGIRAFAAEVSASFSVEVQLLTVSKYLELVNDLLKPKPTIANALLINADSDKSDPVQIAANLLKFLPTLLSQRKLTNQTAKLLERDDMDASKIREIYSTLLETTLALAESVKSDKSLQALCGDVLESLLGLLSTKEFVKSVESLLDRPNQDLRRKILRSVEVRVDRENQSDPASRAALLGFMPQLTAIIRESRDIAYKRTSIACVDKIAEKYGKKDLEAVAAAANTIASDSCLAQSDTRLSVMALLCLASLVEILREAIVPVLPLAIPKALKHIEESLKENAVEADLHNAGYAFMSALIQFLPYMVTGAYLERLLSISSASSAAHLDSDENDAREGCLRLAARQLDAKSMFAALEKNWTVAANAGDLAIYAVRQYVQILTMTIDKHPKSVISKHSATLSNIIFNAMDYRLHFSSHPRRQEFDDELAEVETLVYDATLKMIYKLNDSTFRPIFAKLIEWSTALPKSKKDGQKLRQQSLYGFLMVFFDSLKSIVTSYATYILDSATDILNTVDPSDDDSKVLWAKVLRTLTKCFEYDQDDFWQSPSHFKAVASVLNAQFQHASSLPLETELVPAVVELAAAADSSDHHKEINDGLLKQTRSENASVRLAVVKCQQALTDKLGEEWLSMLPEMLPFISELQEDDSEVVERETQRWIVKIEGVLGESLDSMLQ